MVQQLLQSIGLGLLRMQKAQALHLRTQRASEQQPDLHVFILSFGAQLFWILAFEEYTADTRHLFLDRNRLLLFCQNGMKHKAQTERKDQSDQKYNGIFHKNGRMTK
jgi:hypothetical protein